MNTSKRAIIFAVSLVVIGLIISAAALFAVNFDLTTLSLAQPVTNTHTVEETFTGICIDTEINDIILAPSESTTCQVVCQEEAGYYHTVSVEGRTLTITLQDNRMWYEHIGMTFGASHSITVYLPKKAYEDLTVTCSTGDVEIPKGFSFGVADITTSTGDINWQGSTVNNLILTASTGEIAVEETGCQNLTVKASTGDIRLATTVITQNLSVKTSTGDVRFDRSDAKAISIRTGTGDVTGTLLAYKLFTVNTDTGKFRLPPMPDSLTSTTTTITNEAGKVLATSTSHPGVCKITTSTGDVYLELA